MKHTDGAIRAAIIISNHRDWGIAHGFPEFVTKIIDEETHAAEMLAFIEKVAEWDYKVYRSNVTGFNVEPIEQAQREAFALIKKVRG